MPAANIFTRVQSKDPAVGDIYDKLANILQQLQATPAAPAPTPTPTPTPVPVIPVIPGGGGGGGGSSPYAYTNVPLLSALPSNNPTTGQPYSTDGVLVDVGGALYRYNGTTYNWDPVSNAVLVDTYANWTSANYPPANYPVGTEFLILDWNVKYVVQVVSAANTWVYEFGIYAVAQSGIAGITGFDGGALGVNDTGLQISITDYAHVLEWSGSAWTWGPGESGSGYIQDFAVVPTGSGWHACDGAVGVKFLKADGTTGTVTLPNTASTTAYRKSSNGYTSSITAAAVPTISGETELASTGITVSAAAAATVSTGTALVGLTQTVVTALTSGGGGGGVVTDPQHQHNLTSANAPISLAGGDPVAHYSAISYFRQ